MTQWIYMVIILCLLLLVFLLWAELRNPAKTTRIPRLMASLLAVASLAAMALPLYYTTTATDPANAVLLTEGYSKDSLEIFLQKEGTSIPVYTPGQYSSITVAAPTLHVFGYGLTQPEWQQLPAGTITWHQPERPKGFIAIHWPQQLTAGQPLQVQGTYAPSSGKPVQLRLSAFNSLLDSITITQPQQSFTLTTIPKQLGRAVYTLQAITGKDTLTTSPLPVEVTDAAKLQVLILAASPDFENKFLAGWLAGNGYGITMRTTISRDKYDETFLNTNRITTSLLNASSLSRFDIILADAAALQSAGGSELAAIRTQVAQGTGLLIKADTLFSAGAFYAAAFTLQPAPTPAEKTLLVQTATGIPAPLPNETPVFISGQPGLLPLAWNEKNRMLAAAALYESGNMILTTLHNTYTWLLRGDTTYYQQFWNNLLQQAARRNQQQDSWTVAPFIPRVHAPVQLSLNTATGRMPLAQTGNTVVSLSGHLFLPWQWSGTYWPVNPGWQASFTLQGKTHWWYAFDQNDWNDLLLQQRWQDTQQYLAQHTAASASNTGNSPIRRQVPRWPFFLLFLLACTYLWIESRRMAVGSP